MQYGKNIRGAALDIFTVHISEFSKQGFDTLQKYSNVIKMPWKTAFFLLKKK